MTGRVFAASHARVIVMLPHLSTPPLPPPPDRSSYAVGGVVLSPPVVLAPMEGVTDLVFRRMIRALGGPGLTYTEFFQSRAVRDSGGKVLGAAHFDPDERPIAVQIFGRDPQVMAQAARVVQDMGATIVDINMGCPSKKVCANSGGSALMRDPALAVEIVRQVRRAIEVPLTVKMRAGFDHANRNAPQLARRFEQEGVDALTVHWRTRADGYAGERDVTTIAQVVAAVNIPVLGNGDIIDVASAHAMFSETGCAGVMIGRGAVRDPWLALRLSCWLRGEPQPVVLARERERVLCLYYEKIREAFGTDRAALNRLKMVVRQLAEPLPHGAALRRLVCRAPQPDEALAIAHDYFDRLDALEGGDAEAFGGCAFSVDVQPDEDAA